MALAAGITAGSMLLGQLMGQEAAKRKEERDRKARAEQMGFEAQARGQEQMTQGQQAGLGQLLAAYKSALL